MQQINVWCRFISSAVTSEVWAIGVWAYLGVFVRVAITEHLTSLSSLMLDVGEIQILDTLLSNSYFVPNALGCFIIAVLYSRKESIITQYRQQVLYTGMVTGFCGCLTTFSSWAYGIAADTFNIGVLPSLLLLVSLSSLLSDYLSDCLSVCLSVCASVCVCVCLSVCLCICLSVSECLCIYLYCCVCILINAISKFVKSHFILIFRNVVPFLVAISSILFVSLLLSAYLGNSDCPAAS